MPGIDAAINDLVIANRILAKEGVVDAYGHVSLRHPGNPERFFLSRSLIEVVRMSVYLPRNARALQRARQLGGEIRYLSEGEIAARNKGYSPYSTETWRAWEYWANKAGCGHLLSRPER